MGSEDGANKGPGSRYGGKMVTVKDDSVRRIEVFSIVDALGRSCVRIIGPHDFALNIERVEAVGDGVCA